MEWTMHPGLTALRGRFGDRLRFGESERRNHAGTDGFEPAVPPNAVLKVSSTAEVVDVVNACREHGLPIIPYGAGSSVESQLSATEGGVCLDLSSLDEVRELRPADLDVTVQCGVRRLQLDRYLRDTGLFFPIDPGADASLGGMAATRASGTNAVRYGTMRDNVLSLEAVLADGTVVRTGTRARKSSAGYDLTRLLVGSEGTLGIITELTLRLYGRPECVRAARVPFPTVAAAVDTCIAAIQAGIPVARLELVNALGARAINAYTGIDLPDAALLLVELHGPPAAVAEQTDMLRAIAEDCGALEFQWAASEDERQRLWEARHRAAPAFQALAPGRTLWPTDVCVPISELSRCIVETERDLEEAGLPAPIVGHVGDGNFHVGLLLDRTDPANVAAVEALNARMVERALSLGGTCTGEHGIGLGKRRYMAREHGAGLEVMRALKRTLDPWNILNPGKVV
jgi:D-lactate dehydrogenase (cytochrome)